MENQSASHSDPQSAAYAVKYDLQLECMNPGHIMALCLKARKNTLLVGDLVRSLTLLRYQQPGAPTATGASSSARADASRKPKPELKEIAHDFNSNYMRAIAIMDTSSSGDAAEHDIYFGADTAGNIFSMKYMAKAATEEERSKLEPVGEFHVGDCLNVFEKGTLVGQPIDSEDGVAAGEGGSDGRSTPSRVDHVPSMHAKIAAPYNGIFSSNYVSVTGFKLGTCSMMYGTLSGCIGNVIMLSEESFQFFSTLQRVMKNAIPPVGGLSHADWRMFRNDLRSTPQRNMVDGNFVETLLDRPIDEVKKIVLELNSELNTLFDSSPGKAGGKKAGDVSGGGSETSSTGDMLMNLSSEKIKFTAEDVIRRVEDIARLH